MKNTLTRGEAEQIVLRSRENVERLSAEERSVLVERIRRAGDGMTEEQDRAITIDAFADPNNPPADEWLGRKLDRPRLVLLEQTKKIGLDGNATPEQWAKARSTAEVSIAEMTEEEDREITENARADPDNPPLDEAYPHLSTDEVEQTEVTLRLDSDLIERLRAAGAGWQTRANALLRKAVGLE